MDSSDSARVIVAEQGKSQKLIGAQNEVADMAIKANAELDQVNARLAGLSHHYEQLAKRAEQLADEHEVQAQIVKDLQELYAGGDDLTVGKYAEIVNGEGRYDFVSLLNEKAWREHEHDWDRAADLKAAVNKYLDELIPF